MWNTVFVTSVFFDREKTKPKAAFFPVKKCTSDKNRISHKYGFSFIPFSFEKNLAFHCIYSTSINIQAKHRPCTGNVTEKIAAAWRNSFHRHKLRSDATLWCEFAEWVGGAILRCRRIFQWNVLRSGWNTEKIYHSVFHSAFIHKTSANGINFDTLYLGYFK